jgi:hypothetical protein
MITKSFCFPYSYLFIEHTELGKSCLCSFQSSFGLEVANQREHDGERPQENCQSAKEHHVVVVVSKAKSDNRKQYQAVSSSIEKKLIPSDTRGRRSNTFDSVAR